MAAKQQTDEAKALALVEQLEAEHAPHLHGKAAMALAGADKPKGPITDSLVDRIFDVGKPAIKALLNLLFPKLP